MDCQYRDVARMIDHSLLSPILKVEELEKGIRVALDDGGQELDAVVNLSKVLSGDWDTVAAEVLEECKRRPTDKAQTIRRPVAVGYASAQRGVADNQNLGDGRSQVARGSRKRESAKSRNQNNGARCTAVAPPQVIFLFFRVFVLSCFRDRVQSALQPREPKMARLEESNMIEGRYETRIIDGQTVKERYYRALGHGLRCWEATRDFYARFAILAGTTPGLEVAP